MPVPDLEAAHQKLLQRRASVLQDVQYPRAAGERLLPHTETRLIVAQAKSRQ